MHRGSRHCQPGILERPAGFPGPGRPVRWGLCALALVFVLGAARAETAPPEPVEPALAPPAPGGGLPDDATLEANGARVGEIVVRASNIFDLDKPGENNRLFRTANRLHRTTRDKVIRRILLFESGDPYSARVLAESERLLRSTRFLYDARIRPIRYEDNKVDVEVVTRDVWTFRVGVGFKRSGGENTTRFGIRDTNFLGTGREILVRRTKDVDRTAVAYRLRDPYLAGRRVELELLYSDNTDGDQKKLELGRQFFALDTRWAAAVEAGTENLVQPLYDRGEIFDEFRLRRERYVGFYGISGGHRDGVTRRLKLGLGFERDRYLAVPDRTTQPLPADRELAYPWVGLQWIRDGFVETRDLDRIHRTEDLNLGAELEAWVGWSSTGLGADRDRALFGVEYRLGVEPGQGQIVLARVHASGRFDGGRGENLLAGTSVRYYARNLGRHVFFVGGGFDVARRLDHENQLLLGGDTGLRGYPLRYLPGDRRALITVEQRFYSDLHLFKLVHVGGALFFDAGASWFADRPGERARVYKDVGVGLRLGSSRSASAAMVHVDVAFPLDGDRSISKVQLLVNTRETF